MNNIYDNLSIASRPSQVDRIIEHMSVIRLLTRERLYTEALFINQSIKKPVFRS